MILDLIIVALIGFIAGAAVCWLGSRSASRAPRPAPVEGRKSASILNQLTTELERKGLAKVDRDPAGQVRRVRWAGERGVGITGDGALQSHASSREPDADQGPQL